MSVTVTMMEGCRGRAGEIFGWSTGDIRALFEFHDLALDDWQKDRTDRVRVTPALQGPARPAA